MADVALTIRREDGLESDHETMNPVGWEDLDYEEQKRIIHIATKAIRTEENIDALKDVLEKYPKVAKLMHFFPDDLLARNRTVFLLHESMRLRAPVEVMEAFLDAWPSATRHCFPSRKNWFPLQEYLLLVDRMLVQMNERFLQKLINASPMLLKRKMLHISQGPESIVQILSRQRVDVSNVLVDVIRKQQIDTNTYRKFPWRFGSIGKSFVKSHPVVRLCQSGGSWRALPVLIAKAPTIVPLFQKHNNTMYSDNPKTAKHSGLINQFTSYTLLHVVCERLNEIQKQLQILSPDDCCSIDSPSHIQPQQLPFACLVQVDPQAVFVLDHKERLPLDVAIEQIDSIDKWRWFESTMMLSHLSTMPPLHFVSQHSQRFTVAHRILQYDVEAAAELYEGVLPIHRACASFVLKSKKTNQRDKRCWHPKLRCAWVRRLYEAYPDSLVTYGTIEKEQSQLPWQVLVSSISLKSSLFYTWKTIWSLHFWTFCTK